MKYREPFSKFRDRLLENLRREIKASKISQREQLFKGLDPRNVLRIKKGHYKNMTIRTIWRMAKVFGFNPKDLFKNL